MTPAAPEGDDRWAGSLRRAARLAAIQALYQSEMNDQSASAVTSEFIHHRLSHTTGEDQSPPTDRDHFVVLVEGTEQRIEEIDRLIGGALASEWSLDRLERVLRAVLRAACFELVALPLVPARVVITEYVELAHAFFAGKEPGLVNGVLDRLAHQLRPAEWP